jgi:hypothetical protein
MQQGYRYECVAPIGRDFDPAFTPELTPQEMLALGVFGGKYMTDTRDEFPASWFARAKLSPERRDPSLNFFGVDASQPLAEWRRKGWIHPAIRAAGSSGIAVITWAAACRRKTQGRSSDGRRYDGMSGRSNGTANRAT